MGLKYGYKRPAQELAEITVIKDLLTGLGFKMISEFDWSGYHISKWVNKTNDTALEVEYGRINKILYGDE